VTAKSISIFEIYIYICGCLCVGSGGVSVVEGAKDWKERGVSIKFVRHIGLVWVR